MNKWLMFLPLILLAGCAGKTPPIVVKPDFIIPPQMLQCENTGNRPSGEVIMESDVAKYIAGLEFSNKDCKLRLKEISILVKCYNDPACNIDKLVEYMGIVREEKSQ